MAWITAAVLSVCLSAGFSDPPLAQDGDVPVLPAASAGGEGGKLMDPPPNYSLSYSKCVTFPNGCPAGTTYLPDGNVNGCTIDPINPTPTCVGSASSVMDRG